MPASPSGPAILLKGAVEAVLGSLVLLLKAEGSLPSPLAILVMVPLLSFVQMSLLCTGRRRTFLLSRIVGGGEKAEGEEKLQGPIQTLALSGHHHAGQTVLAKWSCNWEKGRSSHCRCANVPTDGSCLRDFSRLSVNLSLDNPPVWNNFAFSFYIL